MPDKIEQIMKKIHVLFAKSEEYHGSPDKIIISRKEMFDILEELNVAIYDVLDQYEATTRSKEKARLEMERIASDIITDAKKAADDVHAGSLMYTDDMLEAIRAILEETKKATISQFEELQGLLDEKMSWITENKEEVRGQLSELHDKEFYLEVLKEKRAKDKATVRSLLQDIEETEEEEPEEQIVKHAEYVIKVNEAYLNKVPNNSENQKENKGTKETKKIKESAIAAIDEATDEEAAGFAYGEPHVNPEDFDLDGEYYRWKEEQEGGAAEQDNGTKKTKRFLFGRKKEV